MRSPNQRVGLGAAVRLAFIVASLVALAGCGSGSDTDVATGDPTTQPPTPAAPVPVPLNPGGPGGLERESSCAEYSTWRETQDALDSDPDLEAALDEDIDGVACNDLAQEEYEEAFTQATVDGCDAVFLDSPDGYLFWRSARFSVEDCTAIAPPADEWEADPSGDPEADGRTNGWTSACEDFYSAVGNDAVFWGDTVVVSQLDCETAGP